jgi:MFS family permease
MTGSKTYKASTQVLLLSVVFFCCPGLFNALSSIASGLQDATVAFRGNVLVYGFFTVSSVVAAALLPTLAARRSLVLGTLGYVVYALALWNLTTSHSPDTAAALFYTGSGVLGISAGFLWTAQGQMIMSYATPQNQGRYISTFWIIFNLGATSGGLLTCILNWKRDGDEAAMRGNASHATFAAFAVAMTLGSVLAMTRIASLDDVVKADGSRVVVVAEPADSLEAADGSSSARTWKDDARALFAYATSSRDVLCLLPFFVYSNWFYTYHAFFNVSLFNTRTSGLASAFYWMAQMVGALALGRWLDHPGSSPTRTARNTLVMLAVLWNAMWAVGWVVQTSKHLSYASPLGMDVVDDTKSMIGPLVLYTIYGAGDAVGQVWIYWYLSCVCANGREPRIAGFNAGIYKAVQSLSAAFAWWIGSQEVVPVGQLWVNWALCNAAVVGAALSLFRKSGKQDEVELPDNGKYVPVSTPQ